MSGIMPPVIKHGSWEIPIKSGPVKSSHVAGFAANQTYSVILEWLWVKKEYLCELNIKIARGFLDVHPQNMISIDK